MPKILSNLRQLKKIDYASLALIGFGAFAFELYNCLNKAENIFPITLVLFLTLAHLLLNGILIKTCAWFTGNRHKPKKIVESLCPYSLATVLGMFVDYAFNLQGTMIEVSIAFLLFMCTVYLTTIK